MQKETIIFNTNDSTKLEVIYEDGTVWLTQAQISSLLCVKENTVTYHIKEIYSDGELKPEATTRKIRVVRQEGSRKVNRNLDFYNLEMIISVGNRVKFSSINQFKNWAEDVIKARNSSLMIQDNSIRNLIKIIRNQQVMLDSDLAVLYGVETKRLIEQVTRNIERFPEDFMFKLTWEECNNLKSQFVTSSLRSQFATLNTDSRSQIATLNVKKGENIKYLPYAFTEQGVAMLSSVLHSPTAIEANIRIMRAFVGMRHFINENAKLFQRIETIEYNQLEMVQSVKKIENHLQESDRKIEELFDRIDIKEKFPPDGIFFDGQIFDAYLFVSELIKKAKNEIILIDNYVDESVLNVLSKRNENVAATIYTARISHQFQLDLERYNSQYQPITVNTFNRSHDRFLIIDDEVYHIGASLKDLGKKWFAFSLLHCSKELLLNNI